MAIPKQSTYYVMWEGEDEATLVSADSMRHAAETAFLQWAKEEPHEAATIGPVDLTISEAHSGFPSRVFRITPELTAVAAEVTNG